MLIESVLLSALRSQKRNYDDLYQGVAMLLFSSNGYMRLIYFRMFNFLCPFLFLNEDKVRF